MKQEKFALIMVLMFAAFFGFLVYESMQFGHFVDEKGLKEVVRILWEGKE